MSIPFKFGEKRIAIVQLAPAARLEPQWLCWLKKFGETEIRLIAKDPVPVVCERHFLRRTMRADCLRSKINA